MSFGEEMRAASADFDPDDGSYTVELIDGSADYSRDGDPKAKVILKITEGPAAGEVFEHFMFMGNRVGKEIAKDSLDMYGVDWAKVDSIEDLERQLFDLIGTVAFVTVSHKGSFRNVKVTGSRTGKSDVPAPSTDFSKPPPPPEPAQQSFAAAAGMAPGDDDVPF